METCVRCGWCCRDCPCHEGMDFLDDMGIKYDLYGRCPLLKGENECMIWESFTKRQYNDRGCEAQNNRSHFSSSDQTSLKNSRRQALSRKRVKQ